MGPEAKTRYPAEKGWAVAREIERLLGPYCQKIEVAGSLRRKRPEVGDVEILFIPAFEVEQLDLFRSGPVDQAAKRIEELRRQGVLAKRVGKHGGTSWGPNNKFAVYVPAEMPVDLFAATEDTWACNLVCRTGGAQTNIDICEAARRKGYKWNPTGRGFSRLGGGPEVLIETERQLFEFLGIPFPKPEARR